MRRYLSRSGSSTHDRSGSPSSSGTAAPPVPTITLAIRSGCVAAANRAADVPTSGRDDVRPVADRPRRSSSARNSPIARGERRSSRRSDAPKPGQVDGEQPGVLGERGPHRREGVQALRPRAGQQQRRLARAAACRRTGSSGRRSSGIAARSKRSRGAHDSPFRVSSPALTSASFAWSRSRAHAPERAVVCRGEARLDLRLRQPRATARSRSPG